MQTGVEGNHLHQVPEQIYLTGSLEQGMLQEVHRMIRLYMTLPVTIATAERIFSVLRRLKTFLRATRERLNSLLMLHVHKDETDHLDLTKVANEFVQASKMKGGESTLGTFGTVFRD